MTRHVLDELGVAPEQPQSLRQLTVDQIVAAGARVYDEIPTTHPGTLAFAPVVDGDLLPEHPIDVVSEGRGLPVPLMIGTNHDEATLFTHMASPLLPISDTQIDSMLTAIHQERPDVDVPSRQELRAISFGVRTHAVGLGIARDIGFRLPTLWAAEGHATVAPVWLYRFDYATPMLRVIGIGATHATELPYVWGNLDSGDKDLMFRLGGRRTGAALSERMRQRWLRFAVTGDPNGEASSVHWSPFNTDGTRDTLIIDAHDTLAHDPDATLRRAWGEQVISFS